MTETENTMSISHLTLALVRIRDSRIRKKKGITQYSISLRCFLTKTKLLLGRVDKWC